MSKRRPNGDGTIRKRKDGRWEGIIVVGHKSDGKPIYKNVLAKTQKEVTEKLHILMDTYDGVELTEESRMTLSEWLDKWLNDYKAPMLKPSTLNGYRNYIEHYIKPHLGTKNISRITTADIQKMYNDLKANGRIHEHPDLGHQLSDSMIRSIHMMLHEAMKCAVKERLIVSNPTDGTTIPKTNNKEKQILNDRQMDIFMEAIKSDIHWHDFFYTELTTGLRRGEICGLKWDDFDEVNGTLKVQRTIHNESGGALTVGTTKTGQGARKIVLPHSTAELLRFRKKKAVSEWIFPNLLNPENPTNPHTAYRHLKGILRNARLPDLRFHDLRHTFATQALTSGVDAKTLSGILGHERASFTLDTYTHVTTDMQKNASAIVGDFMEELFGKELKPWQEESENPVTAQ